MDVGVYHLPEAHLRLPSTCESNYQNTHTHTQANFIEEKKTLQRSDLIKLVDVSSVQLGHFMRLTNHSLEIGFSFCLFSNHVIALLDHSFHFVVVIVVVVFRVSQLLFDFSVSLTCLSQPTLKLNHFCTPT